MRIRAEKDGSNILIFDGRLDISRAREIRDTLSDVLEKGGETGMDVSGVESVDLAGLQLLCSACRTANAKGGRLFISGNAPEPLCRALRDYGFSLRETCSVREAERCFLGGLSCGKP